MTMDPILVAVLVALFCGGAALLAFMATRNGLVVRYNALIFAATGVDVHLKKRCDLIPNLVATVQALGNLEYSLVTRVSELRQMALALPVASRDRVATEAALSDALRMLFLSVAENHPKLQSNKSFVRLQTSLTRIEEEIAAARRSHAAAVRDFNNLVQGFPTCLVATLFGYASERPFCLSEEERRNPDVKRLTPGTLGRRQGS
jgi:LemA protein